MTLAAHPRIDRLTCRLTGHFWDSVPSHGDDGSTGEAFTCRRCGTEAAEIEPWERRVPRHLPA